MNSDAANFELPRSRADLVAVPELSSVPTPSTFLVPAVVEAGDLRPKSPRQLSQARPDRAARRARILEALPQSSRPRIQEAESQKRTGGRIDERGEAGARTGEQCANTPHSRSWDAL